MTNGRNDSSARRLIAVTRNRVASADLFVGCKTIIISHNDQNYTLRITGNGKLILTK